ncbi:hypothetical protein ACFSQ7_34570 [Paenibacillus rhizoplanae]
MELIINHLTKTYGSKTALQDISFRVGEGIHGLLGAEWGRQNYADAAACHPINAKLRNGRDRRGSLAG